tara:strand:- start:15582 stop:16280 length:699 start_codon:yes stop_codon:yes gene_type:complete
MKKIVCLLVAINFCQVYAQGNFLFGSGVNSPTDMDIRGRYASKMSNAKAVDKVRGTPYMFENWNNNSEILTEDKKTYQIADLNYNVSSDMFAVKISTDSVFIFRPDYLKEVTINNRTFKKKLDVVSGLFNYYEVIATSEKGEILKRSRKTIRTGITNRLTMQREPDYYVLKEDYYYLNFDDESIQELPLKKKNVLKVLGSKSVQIKEYVSEHKLSVKDEEDLQQIFKFYDSL